ncbi:MAG TPA: ferritin family protein [Sedimentisphaerales bacterium]|nr:ferritin family protein [Sedimentisphaerales bacterium]
MVEFESDEEILELAIAREEDANKFYLALAARAQADEMRKVFEDLAGEELEHKAKLELEVIKSGRVVTATEELDIGDERAIGITESDIDMDYKDMLIMAMQKEESSFRLYVDLAVRVTNEDARETLLSLAEEEVKHKLRFETEYDMLQKGSGGGGEAIG